MRVEKFKRVGLRNMAATDGLRIFLDVDRLNELPEEGLNFILLHELLHIIIRHRYPNGMPGYERKFWNIAFDLTANWLMKSMERELRAAGLPFQPLSDSVWCKDDLSKDTSNMIAKAFVDQALQQGMLGQDPPVLIHIQWKSFEDIVPNNADYAFDVLDADPSLPEPVDSEVTALLRDAAKSAGNSGLPSALQDLWEKLSKGKQLPWYLVFKRYLQGMMESDDLDFCPPDKRFLYSEQILPAESWSTGRELRNALVVVDVSGSVDTEELTKQLWQLKRILDELDFQGEILTFASSVVQTGKLTTKETLRKFVDNMQVGGGTCWSSVVKWVQKRKVRPRPIIVFTDGGFFEFTKGLSDVIFILQEYEDSDGFGSLMGGLMGSFGDSQMLRGLGKVITIPAKA